MRPAPETRGVRRRPGGRECVHRLGCLVLLGAAVTAAAPAGTEVRTRAGPVKGFVRRSLDTSWARISTFWGIPFADPPVGPNRLRAPKPLSRTWTEPLSANVRSNICFQWGLLMRNLSASPNEQQSEDCLYLNVYAPTDAIEQGRKLPVMVWIYGGAYTMGDAYTTVLGTSAYDGSALAGRHDVVVVTMNYRLNGLGFFASEALRAEDPQRSTGNMALLDQRLALRWVQENIAAFGGDATRVTLFGESAGAFSVVWHLVSEPSWPLFHRAILESGTSKLSWFFQPYRRHAQEFYAQWAEKIGCPRGGPWHLPCLRMKDVSKLVAPPPGITVAPPTYTPGVTGSLPFGPVLDGSNILDTPINLIRAGRFHKVPLILGACKDGGSIFEPIVTGLVPGLHPPAVHSEREVEVALEWVFSSKQIPLIRAKYPDREFVETPKIGPPHVNYREMFSRMIRDIAFQCSNRAIADAWDEHGVPVWMYTFSFPLGPLDKLSGLGDLHGSDIFFVFRRFLWLPEVLALDGAYEMADVISCKWTTFAHTGVPDGLPSAPLPPHCDEVRSKYAAWPRFRGVQRNDAAPRRYYSLQVPPLVRTIRPSNTWPDDEFPSDSRCDMWDEVDFPWPPHLGNGSAGGTGTSEIFV